MPRAPLARRLAALSNRTASLKVDLEARRLDARAEPPTPTPPRPSAIDVARWPRAGGMPRARARPAPTACDMRGRVCFGHTFPGTCAAPAGRLRSRHTARAAHRSRRRRPGPHTAHPISRPRAGALCLQQCWRHGVRLSAGCSGPLPLRDDVRGAPPPLEPSNPRPHAMAPASPLTSPSLSLICACAGVRAGPLSTAGDLPESSMGLWATAASFTASCGAFMASRPRIRCLCRAHPPALSAPV